MALLTQFPQAWHDCLSEHTRLAILPQLSAFLDEENAHHVVYPPREFLFNALKLLRPDQVKVVIIGQDPYHGLGQGNGLAFSVNEGVKIPPSLRNIYKELYDDLGIAPAKTGCLLPWAQQGVLLLNTVLTVREACANSHKNKGWESVTDDILRYLGAQRKPCVFVLWGSHAKRFHPYIGAHHFVIESAHPSPLSAHRGFLGSRPFSQINDWLLRNEMKAINWKLSTDLF
jgi:uracil-DNA glycosylase